MFNFTIGEGANAISLFDIMGILWFPLLLDYFLIRNIFRKCAEFDISPITLFKLNIKAPWTILSFILVLLASILFGLFYFADGYLLGGIILMISMFLHFSPWLLFLLGLTGTIKGNIDSANITRSIDKVSKMVSDRRKRDELNDAKNRLERATSLYEYASKKHK